MAAAIDAGINFPSLLVSKEESVEDTYEEGLRHRWLLGCLDHLLINFRTKGSKSLSKIVTDNSLKVNFGMRTGFDVLKFSDPIPFLFELKRWISHLVFRR